MFNLYRNDRLNEWKRFRDSIESSQTPLKDVVNLWSLAPFVSSYLDPYEPSQWPDPWHLVLDNKLDELAIVLGMLYTLQLTDRFMKSRFEIHMPAANNNPEKEYYLRVDDHVLNLEYKEVLPVSRLDKIQTNIIWSSFTKK